MKFKVGDKVAIVSWEGHEGFREFQYGTVLNIYWDWDCLVSFDDNHLGIFSPEALVSEAIFNSPTWKLLDEN